MTQEQAETWQRFCRETGHTGEPAFIGAFGDGPDLADELLDLILADRKRATCCLAGWYVRQRLELPRAGDLSLILDGEGRPRCVIRTTAARVPPSARAMPTSHVPRAKAMAASPTGTPPTRTISAAKANVKASSSMRACRSSSNISNGSGRPEPQTEPGRKAYPSGPAACPRPGLPHNVPSWQASASDDGQPAARTPSTSSSYSRTLR